MDTRRQFGVAVAPLLATIALRANNLATADGMWHVQTSFFPAICFMRRPDEFKTYAEWQGWFQEKIDRDFNVKIFFDDEHEQVRPEYEALITVFSKTPLE